MKTSSTSASRPEGRRRPTAGDPIGLLGRLTGRDRLIIETLGEHHVLRTDQLTDLAFPSPEVARHRLLRLHRMQVVDRFRWFTISGSQPWHYTLGPVGATLLAAAAGIDPPRPAELRRRLERLATSPRLSHLLGVNGFFTALAGHARVNPECSLDAWWSERRCAAQYSTIVRPDAYGAWSEAGRRIEFFLEYDTGSESLGRLVAKMPGYADLASAGGPNAVVLFWLPSVAREAHFRRLLGQRPIAGVSVATAAADLAEAAGARPAGPVWLTPGAGRRTRLIDLPHGVESDGL